MDSSEPTNPPGQRPDASAGDTSASKDAAPAARRGLFSRIGDSVRQLGVDAISVALGRLIEPIQTADEGAASTGGDDQAKQPNPTVSRRVRALHDVAETLRGAADSYIAAKLDEIEARVDMKLDEINERIDEKIETLEKQLAELRDQELRHRLHLLKITLVFTMLVAVLSLVYKWISGLISGS